MLDRVMFAAALVFLIGCVLVVASSLPPVAARYRRAMPHGFLLAIAGIALAVVAAVAL